MNTKLRRWLPHVLCCLPGVVAVAIVGVGLLLGETAFAGPLGFGLIALALLACPMSMGLMMWRGMGRKAASGGSPGMAGCCAPDEALAAFEAETSADRLAALRDRREALERELAELQGRI